ncbi:MAG: tetratricopeptide repeat protein [Myxococcota bacterium]|nr:tetratricopeptide repeat protein [Myxococcota bacterium]
MIVICESCGASLDASAAADNSGPITIKCTQCNHVMTSVELINQGTGRIGDTQPKRAAFKVPESTIDAPDPDSVADESTGYPDFATAPEDAFKQKPAVKPLETPLSPTLGTFRPNRKKPPPLPPLGPTGTTAGMIPPSIVPIDDAQTQPVGPLLDASDGALSEMEPLAPGDTEDFPPVGPKASLENESIAPAELAAESAVEPPQETISSIADAVKHLTTGEIPKVTIPAPLEQPLQFTDEKTISPTATTSKKRTGLAWLFFISICVNIALVYLWQSERFPSRGNVATANLGSPASLSNVNGLIFAAQAIQQDTDDGRKMAGLILKSLTIPNDSSKVAQSTVENAKLLLAQLSLDRAQNAALQKQSTAAELTQAEEWLNALSPEANTHPLAPGLRARLHRLAGRTQAANTALKNGPVSKTMTPSFARVLRAGERALLDLPDVAMDASGRIMGLNRLSSDITMLPTYWGLRVEAALAAKRYDLAEQNLLAAPAGSLRAYFRRQLKQQRPVEKSSEKTDDIPVSASEKKTVELAMEKSTKQDRSPSMLKPVSGAMTADKLRPDVSKKTRGGRLSNDESPIERAVAKKRAETGTKKAKPNSVKLAQDTGRESYKSLMKQGSKLLENGRVRQARVKFEAAAKANPNRPSPFVQLGWCEINLQSYSRAVRQFKKALSVSPNHRDASFGLGVAYEKMGRTGQAIKVYEGYLRRHPNDRNTRKIKFRLDRLRP